MAGRNKERTKAAAGPLDSLPGVGELTREAFEGVVVAQNGRIVYCNPSFARMVGHDIEEVLSWSAKQSQALLHPEDRDRVSGYYAARMRGRSAPPQYDCRLVKPDGTAVWLRFYVVFVDFLGHPAVRAACLDITEQRHAEEALRQSEQQLQYVIAHVRDAIFRIDLKGNYVFASAAAERLTGHAAERLLRMNMLELVAPEFHPLVTERLQRRIAGSVPEAPFEFQIVRRDGRRVWVELTTAGVLDGDGRLVGVQGVARDVTDRKEAEAALRRESQQRFRSLFLDAAVAAAVLSPEGQFLQVNPALCSFLGYTKEELTGLNAIKVTHPDDRDLTRAQLRRMRAARGSARRTEKRFLHKNRRVLWGEVSLAAVRDSAGKSLFLIGQVVDLTARKRAEEALQRAHDELDRKVKERTAQLRALAERLTRAEHEERQRLVRVLHDELQQLLVGARFTAGRIGSCPSEADRRRAVRALDGILSEAIATSRSLTTGLRPPVLCEVGLGAALGWLATQMKKDRGLAVRVHGGHVVGPESEEKRDFLFQAVRELLFNVAKHAGVRKAQVRLIRPRRGGIEIVVSDDGKGYDVSRGRPSGLGLFGIRERALVLGGDLRVVSAPGRGTTVTLTLPAE